MSTAVAIVAAAVALACPLHMLARTRQGRRACCGPLRRDPAVEVRERRLALAERIELLADSRARDESAPERH